MISNSGSDERGKYSGGSAGDSTGREWRIIPWYNRPWNCVLRHPNKAVRKKIAELARQAANNNMIGYDQGERWTFWDNLKKVGYYPVNIKVPCEADCSAGVISITWAVGYLLKYQPLIDLYATYTGNMREGYRKAGFLVLTDSKYLTSDKYLLEGDILLNDAHHVATNLTNGIYAEEVDEEVTLTYEQWKEYQKRYEAEKAKEGIPQDSEWQKTSAEFVKEHNISDGLRPHSYVTRVEVWGMFKNFFRALGGDGK